MFYWIPHAVGELHISITVPTQELWLKMAPKIELTNLWPLAAPKWIKWMKRIKKAHHNIHQYLSAYGKLDMGFLRKCAVKDVGLLACEVSEYDLDIFCKKKQSWKKRERPCLRVKWAWTGRPPSLGPLQHFFKPDNNCLPLWHCQNSANKRLALSPAYSRFRFKTFEASESAAKQLRLERQPWGPYLGYEYGQIIASLDGASFTWVNMRVPERPSFLREIGKGKVKLHLGSQGYIHQSIELTQPITKGSNWILFVCTHNPIIQWMGMIIHALISKLHWNIHIQG